MFLRSLIVITIFFGSAALIYSSFTDSRVIIAANISIVLGVFVLWVFYFWKKDERVRRFIDELF